MLSKLTDWYNLGCKDLNPSAQSKSTTGIVVLLDVKFIRQ